MSLTMGYESLDVKMKGTKADIPDNDLAKLMYYLRCVFSIIKFEGAKKYTEAENYYLLSAKEEETVVGLAILFNPKIMIESSLFLVGSNFVPFGYDNEFYEISNNKIGIHVNSEIMIGGVSRKVLMIMGCTEFWLRKNYFKPMESYENKLTENNYKEKDCCESFCSNCCWLDYIYCLTSWMLCFCLCDEDFSSTRKRTIGFIILILYIIFVVIICTVDKNTS